VVTVVQPGNAPPIAPALADMALAVDVAVSADGTQVAVVSASPFNVFPSNVAVYAMSDVTSSTGCCTASGPATMRAQATAVAFDGSGDVVAFLREPAAIFVGSSISTSFPLGSVTIPLGGTTLADDGHDTFHTVTAAALACASCHPEAGDDGRVWQFAGIGPRRTQNIRGGVLARVPFHWSGDVPDMDALVADVLVGRMDGTALSSTQTTDLGTWMDAQPALLPPPPADPAAVARGQALFEDASVGCAGCHDGPQLSDHQIVDVGTGDTGPEPFKVPSLIAVGYRAPYLHNGCAATLLDRFSPPCGGGNQHGNTLQLSADQIGDLVAYLQSL
jgi:mono/diheme cytochrome c family protein